jgi:hypothetical protein
MAARPDTESASSMKRLLLGVLGPSRASSYRRKIGARHTSRTYLESKRAENSGRLGLIGAASPTGLRSNGSRQPTRLDSRWVRQPSARGSSCSDSFRLARLTSTSTSANDARQGRWRQPYPLRVIVGSRTATRPLNRVYFLWGSSQDVE